MHKAQISILETLRHAETAPYSTLMRPTGLESDIFKFHVRSLIKLGLIEKSLDGPYRLTAKGKEFANNLDDVERSLRRQPKLSMILVVSRLGDQGVPQYLFQQRRRNPFFGYWGFLSGPVEWGVDIEEAAGKELEKQVGLAAVCRVRLFYRQCDYDVESNGLLEDKLFVVLEATGVTGELSDLWHGGHNQWMTVDELRSQQRYFALTDEVLDGLRLGKSYMSRDTYYGLDDY